MYWLGAIAFLLLIFSVSAFIDGATGFGILLITVCVGILIGMGYQQVKVRREYREALERRAQNEAIRQQHQAVRWRNEEEAAQKWWKDHHRGLWDPNYLPKPKYVEKPPVEPRRVENKSKANDPDQKAYEEWLNQRVKPNAQKFGVSPRGAEELTAEWLVYLGEADVEITQYSQDGGADVLTNKYCCQVKNYDKKPVGVVEVRALLGTAVSQGLKPLLFTSSSLSKDALDFSNSNSIAVVEFDAINATLFGANEFGEKFLETGMYKSAWEGS